MINFLSAGVERQNLRNETYPDAVYGSQHKTNDFYCAAVYIVGYSEVQPRDIHGTTTANLNHFYLVKRAHQQQLNLSKLRGSILYQGRGHKLACGAANTNANDIYIHGHSIVN